VLELLRRHQDRKLLFAAGPRVADKPSLVFGLAGVGRARQRRMASRKSDAREFLWCRPEGAQLTGEGVGKIGERIQDGDRL